MVTTSCGNMWRSLTYDDLFVINGSSFIRDDGSLIMSCGVAKQAREKIRGIDKLLGKLVEDDCGHLGYYGFIPFLCKVNGRSHLMGLCQISAHFAERPSLDTIELSAHLLYDFYVNRVEPRPSRIDWAMPGVGIPRGLGIDTVFRKISSIFSDQTIPIVLWTFN